MIYIISEKDYIKLGKDYVLLDYNDLVYLDGKKSYYIDRTQNGEYCIHSGENTMYTGSGISYITTINDGNDIRSLFVGDSQDKTIHIYGNNGYYREIVYDRLYDSRNLLYSYGGKLYFQTFEIGAISESENISLRTQEHLTSCGRTYKFLEYYSSSKSTYYQIVCMDGNHE